MGNCCTSGEEDQVAYSGKKVNAFQGAGHRLGSAEETQKLNTAAPQTNTMRQDEEEHLPAPAHDPTLTASDRDQQRANRLAAAEARLKKQGGKPKKKASNSGEPLRGPNSQNFMSWNVGN
mmetsp:Transcript_8257/g.12050  ORF Transcript_8257/g.12050 Transcript_8257/m.12050 type:complete len:120 (-) Transcript_8257:1012-1371(-)